MSPTPTAFLVDDDPAVLRAIARLLRSAGILACTFDSARRFLDEYDRSTPGCLVLDLSMPRCGGLELQAELQARNIQIPIVFLTGQASVPSTVRAMKGGAVDFLIKPCNDEELIGAVRRAIQIDVTGRRQNLGLADAKHCLATLTPREREVLGLVVSGRANKQTATSLGVSEKTIKVHRARVMAKMGAESLADLVRMADRLGVSPEDGPKGADMDQGPIPASAPGR